MRLYCVRHLINRVIINILLTLFRYSIIAGKLLDQLLAHSVTVFSSLIGSYHLIAIYNWSLMPAIIDYNRLITYGIVIVLS